MRLLRERLSSTVRNVGFPQGTHPQNTDVTLRHSDLHKPTSSPERVLRPQFSKLFEWNAGMGTTIATSISRLPIWSERISRVHSFCDDAVGGRLKRQSYGAEVVVMDQSNHPESRKLEYLHQSMPWKLRIAVRRLTLSPRAVELLLILSCFSEWFLGEKPRTHLV